MTLCLFLHTVRHLRFIQLYYQLKYRICKPTYREHTPVLKGQINLRQSVIKPNCLTGESFTFLNLTADFDSWNDTSRGMLWTYNLNYMDWLLQADMSYALGATWIERFILTIKDNHIGLDPYPIALRGINWIKFICKYRTEISEETLQRWNQSLYSQYVLLNKKIEYHLLGNHLLEDACSLFLASIYFNDKRFYSKASTILFKQLNEQILADGAHYEQSPMYHCILLDRILDCYNAALHNNCFPMQQSLRALLAQTAEKMLGHLEQIQYSNGEYPLFNDSAKHLAPTPDQIYAYAKEMGLCWHPLTLGACGYRKLTSESMEAFLDIGNITASYQPGHSHADTFNYELRIMGVPFVVDTGISTYEKTSRRQYERSTPAHNTVCVCGKDSSQVWGGFRMAKRARVRTIMDTKQTVEAQHDGYGKQCLHTRRFCISKASFDITDRLSAPSEAISYIHLGANIAVHSIQSDVIETNLATLVCKGHSSIELIDGTASQQYNRFQNIKIIKIHFRQAMSYSIKPNV